jgi:hypothetical protein
MFTIPTTGININIYLIILELFSVNYQIYEYIFDWGKITINNQSIMVKIPRLYLKITVH